VSENVVPVVVVSKLLEEGVNPLTVLPKRL